MKYDLPGDQGEVLPNLLGLTEQRAVELAEAEGFLRAEITLYDELEDGTIFDVAYVQRMHRLALGHRCLRRQVAGGEPFQRRLQLPICQVPRCDDARV
ncbi:MAG TPA: hypothetical protein PKY96_07905 [Flavobacteriales bacterium]|nr:hypothetical protein [Flavobacteriales bacterium]